MRYFYDCEFLEDGSTIELISIGIVAEDGREYYAVFEEITAEPLYTRIGHHRWLMENVVPHLPLRERDPITAPNAQYAGRFYLDMDDLRILPRRVIRNQVREFLLVGNPYRDWRKTELWAYYGAYDHVALAQLWGPMVRLPKGIPMWTNDIMQLAAGRDLPEQAEGQHDALADARHVKAMYEHLTTPAVTR